MTDLLCDINMDDSFDEIGSSELTSVDMELLNKIEDTQTYREPLINKKTWAQMCDTSDDEDDDWFQQNVANNKALLEELERDTNQTIKVEREQAPHNNKRTNKLLSISEEEDQNEDEELVNMMQKNMDETQFIDNIKKSSAESRKRLSDVPLNRLSNFSGKPKKTKVEDLFRSVQQATTSNLSSSAPSGRGFLETRRQADSEKRNGGRSRLRLSSFECKRNSRHQAPSPTPSRLSTSSSMSTLSYCNDPEVIQRRQKQIDYGKNTIGYQEYIRQIPKFKRSKEDPKTPNKNLSYSRRSWDAQIKLWRIKLHSFDPPECQASSSDDIDLTDIVSCDILC